LDDISAAGVLIYDLFKRRGQVKLKRDLVLGHAILSNPFSKPLIARLDFKGDLDLSISFREYAIPSSFINIEYYSYDLKNDKAGRVKDVIAGQILLQGNETVVAKFRLNDFFTLKGLINPGSDFWQKLSVGAGFEKIDRDRPMVQGLKLVVRDAYRKELSTSYPVAWSDDHKNRFRRTARTPH
jgi:hypothetical protein